MMVSPHLQSLLLSMNYSDSPHNGSPDILSNTPSLPEHDQETVDATDAFNQALLAIMQPLIQRDAPAACPQAETTLARSPMLTTRPLAMPALIATDTPLPLNQAAFCAVSNPAVPTQVQAQVQSLQGIPVNQHHPVATAPSPLMTTARPEPLNALLMETATLRAARQETAPGHFQAGSSVAAPLADGTITPTFTTQEGLAAAQPGQLSPLAPSPAPLPSPGVSHAPLILSGQAEQWAEQLHTALGERLTLQMTHKTRHAHIRLDPPELGKIDIALDMAPGRIKVVIQAAQDDVMHALKLISPALRQQLAENQNMVVSLDISADAGHHHQHPASDRFMPFAGTATQDSAPPADSAPTTRLRPQDTSIIATI